MRSVWQLVSRVSPALIPWGLLVVIVGLAGPFGTYDSLTVSARLGFWLALIALAVPVSALCRAWVNRWLQGRPARLRAAGVAAMFALAYTPLLYVATLGLQRRGLAQMVPLWQMGLVTFLSAQAVCAVRRCLGEHPAGPAAPMAADAPLPSEPSRLVERLPPELHGALRKISVRDHYVDVHTEKGTGSLLLRLSDAIAEVGPVPGAQVHRSHWVAWAAVSGVERGKGGTVLLLTCGCRVPVSRANRDKLAGQGLI